MKTMYLNNWDCKEDMICDFEGVYDVEKLTPEHIAKYDHVEVILASYNQESYEGSAYVLFRNTKDGELYENYASHCSCFGLEEQWGEELTTLDSLKHRVTEGNLGSNSSNPFKDEIRQVIHELESAR
jgi:hypothetical protein